MYTAVVMELKVTSTADCLGCTNL